MAKIEQDDSIRLPQRTRLLWLACVLALTVIAPAQAQTTYSETVLHNFVSPPRGANPYAGVIRDSAGNLYGTVETGGTAGWGAVFKVNTAGAQTLLYNFTGGADGGNPYAGLIGDSSGNFYGTASQGGTGGDGVVFKVDKTGHETVLYSFAWGGMGGTDGAYPSSSLTRDPAGNFYGTTRYGGAANQGVLYKLDTKGHETVLYTFTGGADGGSPQAGVIRDSAGNLYGTAPNGGTAGAGLVYMLDTSGHETVLYNFTGGADGGNPIAGVVRDSSGNLYGTTSTGGAAYYDYQGVVFKLDTAGNETVLYSFMGGSDGGQPQGGVVLDSTGNLYGTVTGGGPNPGAVFEVSAAGYMTVLHTFTGGADGCHPFAGVILDSAGNLYGTTTYGGAANGGVLFEVDTAGQETVLYSFPGAADGSYPDAGVIRDSAGNFYGTTSAGGAAGFGVVYKLDTAGHETVLHTFTGGADGGAPNAGLIRDSTGNLYGTAYQGGTAGCGVVYKLDTAGNETVLYTFTCGADGGYPVAGVIRDSAGNLYGTTSGGGTANWNGVLYRLDTTGKERVLFRFTGGAGGSSPQSGVVRDSAGNFYGTAGGGAANAGVVYKVLAGQETVLYTFTGGADGNRPLGGVIRDSAGNLYGTTFFGGAFGNGVVYEVDTSGHETVLYSFGAGGNDGGNPMAGVIRDSAGNLYGTNSNGGQGGRGAVYELDSTGHYTVLYSFGGASGGDAHAGVIRDASGDLYGTTYLGGKRNVGVVFKLKP